MEGLSSSEKQALSQEANEQLSHDNPLDDYSMDWDNGTVLDGKCSCDCPNKATQWVGSFLMCNHHADIAMLAAH